MNKEEAFEVEELLKELEKYEYPFIKTRIARVKEVLLPIFDNEREKEFRRKRNIKYSWGNYTPLSRVSQAQGALIQVTTFYDEAKNEIVQHDRETQDILHALELTNLTDQEFLELMKRLQQVRKFRRKAKDFLQAVEPIYIFAQRNKQFVQQLGKLYKDVQENINKLNARTYTPRELTALEEAFKQAGVTKEKEGITNVVER